jgi:hypothetical protein
MAPKNKKRKADDESDSPKKLKLTHRDGRFYQQGNQTGSRNSTSTASSSALSKIFDGYRGKLSQLCNLRQDEADIL